MLKLTCHRHLHEELISFEIAPNHRSVFFCSECHKELFTKGFKSGVECERKIACISKGEKDA